MTKNYKYIYGPVPSWRLGSSLGIDPISYGKKTCSFDCVYCQLGKTDIFTDERKIFVPAAEIIEELNLLPPLEIDYITFSGTGEPTLAENLGDMMKAVKKIRREKIAVLTNSSLMHREDVQKDLFLADFVVAKLDAPSQAVFEQVNKPLNTSKIENIIRAIKDFKSCYVGRLALQIMFIKQNKHYASELAKIAKEINPDEVQINTPLRPCRVEPLPESELNVIKGHFKGLNAIFVYEAEKKEVASISDEDTLKRRGKI
ncbi:MAG: radical SAM protein [Candidatus Omnitrophica bacterium]|nr:radical SAM protein [Candidatus Omnitrophota bacterium]